MYQQLKAERDELDEECSQLHEKNGDLNLELQKFQEELQQAREEIHQLELKQQSLVKSDEKDALIAQLRTYLEDEHQRQLKATVRSFELKGSLEEAQAKIEKLEAEIAALKTTAADAGRSKPQPETELPDLYEIRDRVLKDVRSDKLKAVSSALDKFVAELKLVDS